MLAVATVAVALFALVLASPGSRRGRRLGPRPCAGGHPGRWAGRPPHGQARLAGCGVDLVRELLRAGQAPPAGRHTRRGSGREQTSRPGRPKTSSPRSQASSTRPPSTGRRFVRAGRSRSARARGAAGPSTGCSSRRAVACNCGSGSTASSYRPIVFRGVNPDGTPAGFQLAVLGLDYVSPDVAAFDTDAPVLVRGTVLGESCRPTRARIDAFLTGSMYSKAAIASGRSGTDGTFTLRAEPGQCSRRRPPQLPPERSERRELLFRPFSRTVRDGRWSPAAPIRIELDPASC